MPSLRRLLLVACVLAGLTASVAVAAPRHDNGTSDAPSLQPLTHHGRWFTLPDGRTVILHGFNLVAKTPPYEPAATGFGEDDAQFLEDHGFNAVRLGIIAKAVEPRPGKFNDDYLRSIASTVHLLGRHGVYSLLDFHQDLYNERFQGEGLPDWMVDDDGLPAQPQAGFPGNYFAMPALWRAFDHLWANDPVPGRVSVGLRAAYAQMWAHVAARFRGDADVLGYDIFNEPFPGSPYLSCFPPAGCQTFDASLLKPFMAASVHAIHRVDPGHIAFIEPWVTFDYSAPTYLGKVGDTNTGLSFHPYCLAALNLPVPDAGPVRTFCDVAAEGRTFTNAEKQISASGEVPLVTEFGATSDQAELRSVRNMADFHRMGWLDWAYCACGDPTGAGSIESLVYDVRKPPTGSNVNRGNLEVLERPYPLAVSGVPAEYSYDDATQVFSFMWGPSSPYSPLPKARDTVLYIPRSLYPHGYRVHHNAEVTIISRPGSSRLVVRALSGSGWAIAVRPA